MEEAIVVASDLKKRFGSVVALDGVSFSVDRGEVVGILGPNGAGKTTAMRILTTYLAADEGTASIAGFDVARDSLRARRRLGYLPENNPLYTSATVEGYLGFIARMRGLHDVQRRVLRAVETCGLETVVGREVGELSKGFRQRVGLGQALIHDPDVLILDEPTSGLDPNQIVEIRELIKGIGREKTVLLCSHILPEVAATCGRVIIVHKGRIVGEGTPAELVEQVRGHDTVHADVRGPLEKVRDALARLPGVLSCDAASAEGGLARCRLTVERGSGAAEAVFASASRHKWSLLELHTESLTLEDVFQRLTVGEEAR